MTPEPPAASWSTIGAMAGAKPHRGRTLLWNAATMVTAMSAYRAFDRSPVVIVAAIGWLLAGACVLWPWLCGDTGRASRGITLVLTAVTVALLVGGP